MTRADNGAPTSLDRLAGRLRALRESTEPKISQTAAASHIGVSQGKLSRAETGLFLLDPELVGALANLYAANQEETTHLVEWAEALKPGRVDSRLIFQRGTNHFQERIRRMEEASALVRSYQPGMLIGSLQTPAYASAVFGRRPTEDATASIASRLSRYRMMLDDPGRSWTLIQTEGALTWNLGGANVMAEQLDHLITASHLPNVRLGVITHATPMTFAAPHGFHIYDRQAVQIGTKTATALTSDARDLDVYDELFSKLEDAAVFDDEARDVISKIAAKYRDLAGA